MRGSIARLIILIGFLLGGVHLTATSSRGQPNGEPPVRVIGQEGWTHVAEQVRLGAYHIVWQQPSGKEAAHYAANPSQNFLAVFTSQGLTLTPRHGDDQPQSQETNASWLWALRPIAVGRGEALISVASDAHLLRSVAQRMEIDWGGGLTEWYVNDERGIEQGFVVQSRPRGDGAQPLSIDLLLQTELLPAVEPDGSLRFQDTQGATILRYSDLYAFDATGRALSAWLELTDLERESDAPALYRLRIVVKDDGAFYPLLIDPLITGQVKQLTASDGASGDQLGYAVALAGDRLVVGAPSDDVGINAAQGAAYLFERNQGGANVWGQVKKLIASDGAAFDNFGAAVALSGDTIVVGASGDNVDDNTDQGAAYLFERNQGGAGAWGQFKKLTASDGAAFDNFGGSLGVSEDVVVVGASGDDIGENANQGAAYLFARNQGGSGAWGEVKKIVSNDGSAGGFFGAAAAIAAETAVIGAPGVRVGGKESQGAAYLFQRNHGGPNGWGQVARLTANDGAAFDSFGVAVAAAGERVVVGASGADVEGRIDQGAAYLFARNQDGADQWGQEKKLLATNGASSDRFGAAVAVDMDTVMVGARANNVGINNDQGSAYIFERDHGGAAAWGQLARITSPDGATNDGFGAAVAVDGSTFVAGAPGKRVGDNFDQGAAYVFVLEISRLADLGIQKSVTPTAALPGAVLTYTLSFDNAGPGSAIDILVSDTLPMSVAVTSVITSVSGQGVRIVQSGAPPNLTWSVNWLDRNDGGVITITGRVLDNPVLAGATLTNTAAITATNDITPGNNRASATVTVIPPPAILTVTKVVVNDNGGTKAASDFPLFVNGTPVTSGVASTLNAGLYTVSETSASGYTATFSGDCDASGKVTLTPGDVKSCILTNDDQPALLTVTKVVVNDNGGTKTVSDFPLFVNGTPVTSGVASTLDAGIYTVTETSASGYTATFSDDCDASGKVTLTPGAVKSCILTNDDQPQLPDGSVVYLPVVVK